VGEIFDWMSSGEDCGRITNLKEWKITGLGTCVGPGIKEKLKDQEKDGQTDFKSRK